MKNKTFSNHKKTDKSGLENGEAKSLWRQLAAIASAKPLPKKKAGWEDSEHFNRCLPLGIQCAAAFGVEKPKAVFTEAYWSVLNKRPLPNSKAWRYFPFRTACRAISAMRREATGIPKFPTVSVDEQGNEPAATPQINLELTWLSEKWRDLLSSLPEPERQIFVLRHFLGWSNDQIAAAAIAGSTEVAVKVRLSRVKAKLGATARSLKPRAG